MDSATEAFIEEALASPVVSIDTETLPLVPGADKEDSIPSRCRIEALSAATGDPNKPNARAWLFIGSDKYQTDFKVLRDRFLEPLFADPAKTIVMWNKPYDLQVLGQYGIRPVNPENVHDAMIAAFLVDENQPLKLKTRAKLDLGVTDALSYTATEEELRKILKSADTEARRLAEKGWLWYKEHRRSVPEQAEPPSGLVPWQQVAWKLGPGMKKDETIRALRARYVVGTRKVAQVKRDERFLDYSTKDARWTYILYAIYRTLLEEDGRLWPIFEKIENPIAEIVQEMEETGVRLHRKRMSYVNDQVAEMVKIAEDRVAEAVKPYEPFYRKSDKDRKVPLSFNPDSSQMMAELIWTKLKLKPPKWAKATKAGTITTDADVMEYLAEQGATIPQLILDYRKRAKLHSTYTAPLHRMGQADPEGRVHASYTSVGAETGRWSGHTPNMMNQPNADKMPSKPLPAGVTTAPLGYTLLMDGKTGQPKLVTIDGVECHQAQLESLRHCVIAPKGKKLVVVDLSQIELRVMAFCSGDPTLRMAYRHWDCAACGGSGELSKASFTCPNCGAPPGKRDKKDPAQPAVKDFCLGLDIHTITGLEVGLIERYGFEYGRKLSKPVNFGLIYGELPSTLAKELDIPLEEAEEVHTAYFRKYYGVRQFHGSIQKVVVSKGQFRSLVGRLMRFHADAAELRAGRLTWGEEKHLWNRVFNRPIQGGAADIYKIGLLRLRKRLHEEGLRKSPHQVFPEDAVRFLIPVHDEIVMEAEEAVAEKAMRLCEESFNSAMKNHSRFDVPLLSDGKICDTWAEAK